VAADIETAVGIPVLHIADATADVLIRDGVKTVGLLGTAFTMEHDFYKGRLQRNYAIDVVVPKRNDRKRVHDIIYTELCLGRIRDASKADYLRIIEDLARSGAEGVILGCTEIGMLVAQSDTRVSLYDTTAIHAEKAVAYALERS
jgi:aspartate racemase